LKSILVISEKYWPYGGAELATHLILKVLASSNVGLKITVLTGSKSVEHVSNVKCIYSRMLDVSTKPYLWKNLILMSRVGWFRRLIEGADVVDLPRIAYPIIPSAKKYGKKVVVHLHNYQPLDFQSMLLYPQDERKFKRGVFNSMRYSVKLEMLEYEDPKRALASSIMSPSNILCKLWLLQADDVVCVSRKQAEIVAKEMPELASKVRVVYNPLPKIPFVRKKLPKRPSVNICYLGGDYYTKGFHTFLRASVNILKKYPSLKFLLTRDYKETNRLLFERLNEKFGRAYTVLGYLNYEEMLKLHSINQALLFPSISEEPLPYVVLEAMLCGTIPIASRVGGVPEIVEGSFAEKMLFEPYNVEECVDRIDSLLAMSKEQVMDVGFGLKESVLRKFDSEATKNKLMAVFSS